MTQKFSDNGRALLAASILSTDTSLTVEAGKADRFPVATTVSWSSVLDWFKCVLIDSSGNREVIKVGTRTLGSGVFGNILRAQDGTTALAFTAGSLAICPITAADMQAALNGSFASLISAGTLDVAGKMRQNGLEGRFTPVGGIIMWSGALAALPVGWGFCDGTNGTPDLRDKFVVGASVDNAGASNTTITGANSKTGGSKDSVTVSHTHVLTGNTLGQSADHTHVGSTDSQGDHRHQALTGDDGAGLKGTTDPVTNALATAGGVGSTYNDAPGGLPVSPFVSTTGAHVHGVTTTGVSADHTHALGGSASATGVSGTNANLVPYYALAFIMCLAA